MDKIQKLEQENKQLNESLDVFTNQFNEAQTANKFYLKKNQQLEQKLEKIRFASRKWQLAELDEILD